MPSTLGITLAGTFSSQFDPDAIAFLGAVGLTDTATLYAINNLVIGMKLNGLWTKMQAIYPFVGSTSTTQKWNLKDPRDLDAAFRLTFNGGVTHDSNGITPNGTNGYADTFYTPSTNGSQNDQHVSIYSRTNSATNVKDFGTQSAANNTLLLGIRTASPDFFCSSGVNSSSDLAAGLFPASTGLVCLSRTASASFKVFRNGILEKTVSNASAGRSSNKLVLGANNNSGTIGEFSARNYAFASIGTGLTDTEVTVLTSLVQRFQNGLSRQVESIPTVQDIDAQNFLVVAGITGSTQAQAVQNLTAGLKYYSLWSKMQAIYPFVGGSATTHKWNLKDPKNLDTSWRLVFEGGVTQNSNGITPNGTNGYVNTNYIPNTSGSQNDQHVSIYSRTNVAENSKDFGTQSASNNTLLLGIRTASPDFFAASGVNSSSDLAAGLFAGSTGHFVVSRTDSASFKVFRNGTSAKTVSNASAGRSTNNLLFGANNNSQVIGEFSTRNYAFASIGTGLTDTEVSNFNTVVQNYQTELSR